jgi:hypothetical protein
MQGIIQWFYTALDVEELVPDPAGICIGCDATDLGGEGKTGFRITKKMERSVRCLNLDDAFPSGRDRVFIMSKVKSNCGKKRFHIA